MQKKEKLLEVDLYKPIQTYFSKAGYEVFGEVKDCDIAAVKGDEVVVVELKLSLSVDLLIQGTKRQRLTDLVYIAIPRPKLRSKRWADICHLVRRLELGLIVVSPSGRGKKVEIIHHPTPFDRVNSLRRNKGKRETLLKEMEGRSGDFNIGGSTRTKIMTAYKENCLQIACYLDTCGPLSPKALVEMGTGKKTASILTKNFYQWFDRVKRGTYVISEKGKQDLKEYPDLVQYYLEKLEAKGDNHE